MNGDDFEQSVPGFLHFTGSGINEKIVKFMFKMNRGIDFYKNRNYPVAVDSLEYSDKDYILHSNLGSIMLTYEGGRYLTTEDQTPQDLSGKQIVWKNSGISSLVEPDRPVFNS